MLGIAIDDVRGASGSCGFALFEAGGGGNNLSPQVRCDLYRRKPYAASRSGYEHMLLRLQIGARAQCMQRRGESDQKACALFERQSFRQLVQHRFWNDSLFCEGAGSLAHDDPIAGTKVLHARAGLNYHSTRFHAWYERQYWLELIFTCYH